MRLTLRTLLAYLDDTLEPAQAKIIGQKVAESDQARELMDHIKLVTRRRRITTPPASGPGGKIDPNTIAEYLDGAVSPEQASEVEQICLASDAHLAEMAACHQILALVLGEPALVPPTSKLRMYSLVKGPESIPFRRPTNPQATESELAYAGEDVDETLRMGLPMLGEGGKWTNIILLISAGIAASVLLFLAIWHVLTLPGGAEDDNHGKGGAVAQGTQNPPEMEPAPKPTPKDKETPKEKPKLIDKKETPKDIKDKPKNKEDDKWPDIPPPKLELPNEKGSEGGDMMPENRFAKPDNRIRPVGVYVMPPAKEPSIVAYRPGDKGKDLWKRLWAGNVKVESGNTYVALPGYRGDLLLDRGPSKGAVLLTLAGDLPEFRPELLESVVDLHSHDAYIDLTLQRGRIGLTCLKDVPVAIKVRFENPHTPQKPEMADLVLHEKDSQVVIARVGKFRPDSAFVKDPEAVSRVVPDYFVFFWVTKGRASIRLQNTVHSMTSPPGPALLQWFSEPGLKTEEKQVKEFDYYPYLVMPPLERFDDKAQKKYIEGLLKAEFDLSLELGTKGFDVGLAEGMDQKDIFRRIMVVRAYAALGNLDELADILKNENQAECYFYAIEGLRNQMRSARDAEYAVYDLFKTRYSAKESEKIMELLRFHIPTPDLLVDYLDNDNVIIRQVAFNVLQGFPGAGTIHYDALMPAEKRMAAQFQFRKLLKKLQDDSQKK